MMNLNAPTHVRRRLAALALAVAMVGAACGSTPPARSGAPADPVTLSSVMVGGGGSVGGDVLERLVQTTTAGAVRVAAPQLEPAGDNSEGEALAALRAGQVDIAVLRSDAFASAGATSLSVLGLPMLVQSVEHADRIAADPVAEDLMGDLATLDLVGLALVPGGLRHPFGYGAPLLGTDDYAGQVINTRFGDGVDAIMHALGATTDHSVDEARSVLARSGEMRGIEVSLQQPGAVDRPAVVTSNVTLYTKFDVIVVRADVWKRLSEGQQVELQQAAHRAGAEAIAGRDSEVDGLNRWCATKGGSSVVADTATLDELRAALQPVVDAAVAKPDVKRLVDRVTELGKGTTPTPGKECGTPPDTTDGGAQTTTSGSNPYDVEPVGPQDVLEGVWRLEVSRQTLIDYGVSPQEAGANAGIWTITIAGNTADVDQPNGPNCTWEFHFSGNQFSINYAADGNDACYGLSAGTYDIDGDVVRFHFDRARDNDPALDNGIWADGMHRIE